MVGGETKGEEEGKGREGVESCRFDADASPPPPRTSLLPLILGPKPALLLPRSKPRNLPCGRAK